MKPESVCVKKEKRMIEERGGGEREEEGNFLLLLCCLCRSLWTEKQKKEKKNASSTEIGPLFFSPFFSIEALFFPGVRGRHSRLSPDRCSDFCEGLQKVERECVCVCVCVCERMK